MFNFSYKINHQGKRPRIGAIVRANGSRIIRYAAPVFAAAMLFMGTACNDVSAQPTPSEIHSQHSIGWEMYCQRYGYDVDTKDPEAENRFYDGYVGSVEQEKDLGMYDMGELRLWSDLTDRVEIDEDGMCFVIVNLARKQGFQVDLNTAVTLQHWQNECYSCTYVLKWDDTKDCYVIA